MSEQTIQDWETSPQDLTDPDTAVLGVVPDTAADLIEANETGDLISEPMTTDQAREITDAIRSTSEVLYTLIQRAHQGKAWLSLGYGSFAEYVREEFAMSRSRAYQILDQARVIDAIEAAAPDGASLPHITEAAARDLKSVLGEIGPAITEATSGLDDPDEAGRVVEEIVEDYRDRANDRREEAILDHEEEALDRAERAGNSDYAPDGPPPMPYLPPNDYDDDADDFDPIAVRRNVQAAYDLYSAINALKAMPDVDSVIGAIPAERRAHVSTDLLPSLEWLAEFRMAWEAQPWFNDQGNGAQDAEGTDGDDYDLYDDETDSDLPDAI